MDVTVAEFGALLDSLLTTNNGGMNAGDQLLETLHGEVRSSSEKKKDCGGQRDDR